MEVKEIKEDDFLKIQQTKEKINAMKKKMADTVEKAKQEVKKEVKEDKKINV